LSCILQRRKIVNELILSRRANCGALLIRPDVPPNPLMSRWLVGWFASLGSIKMVKNCIGRMPKYGRPTRWRISRGYLKFMWATERFCASSSEHRTPSGSQLTADKKEQPFRGTRSLRLVDLAKTVGRVPAESSTGNTCSARASSSLGPACVYHAPVNMMMTAADDYGFYAVPKNRGNQEYYNPIIFLFLKVLLLVRLVSEVDMLGWYDVKSFVTQPLQPHHLIILLIREFKPFPSTLTLKCHQVALLN